MMDEDTRKKKRIQRIKQMGLMSNPEQCYKANTYQYHNLVEEGSTENDWERLEQLKQIQAIKDAHKLELLDKVTSNMSVLNQKTLNISSGQPYLIEMEVQNDEDRKAVLKVRIDDEDMKEGFIQSHELTLVDNSSQEWEQYIKHKPVNCTSGLKKPSNYSQVSAANMQVKLDPCQNMTLLFKYQSLRQPVVTQKGGNVVDKNNDLLPRNVKINIVSESEDVVGEMQINIEPREMLCDQVFRYYQPEKIKCYLSLPNFLKYQGVGAQHPLNMCKILCSNKNIKIYSIDNETLGVDCQN